MIINPQSSLMFLAFLLIAFCLLHGCAEPSIVYKDKLVPVKCEIDKTPEPVETGNLGVDIRSIFIYTEILEKDIETCTKIGGTK